MRLSWPENAYSHAHFLPRAMLTREVGRNDLVLECYQGLLVGPNMQNYKSLCAAVTPCATLVNIPTDRQTQTHIQHLIGLYEKLGQLS